MLKLGGADDTSTQLRRQAAAWALLHRAVLKMVAQAVHLHAAKHAATAEPAELTQKQIFEYLRHILIRNFDTQKTHKKQLLLHSLDFLGAAFKVQMLLAMPGNGVVQTPHVSLQTRVSKDCVHLK